MTHISSGKGRESNPGRTVEQPPLYQLCHCSHINTGLPSGLVVPPFFQRDPKTCQNCGAYKSFFIAFYHPHQHPQFANSEKSLFYLLSLPTSLTILSWPSPSLPPSRPPLLSIYVSLPPPSPHLQQRRYFYVATRASLFRKV